jgi:hypothetical protein
LDVVPAIKLVRFGNEINSLRELPKRNPGIEFANMNIGYQRIINQQLYSPRFKRPADLVHWMGAVQAQDYYGAKWAVGQRLKGATDATIENALDQGEILRTHIMRPTWHFVSAQDIRWLLQLTAPRVNAVVGSYYRKYELDDGVFRRTRKAIINALKGGKNLTREQLRLAMTNTGISTQGLRFIFILARAELDGLICSGPRVGKQITYALLDERVPPTKPLARDEALAELTQRYFKSHGPATLEDFAWWSGLSVVDVRAGISMVRSQFVESVIEDKRYWLSTSKPNKTRTAGKAYLLPTYDEYLIGYKDRSAALSSTSKGKKASNPVFSSPIVIDSRVVGTWKRTIQNDRAVLKLDLSAKYGRVERQAIAKAAGRYGEFLGVQVEIMGI